MLLPTLILTPTPLFKADTNSPLRDLVSNNFRSPPSAGVDPLLGLDQHLAANMDVEDGCGFNSSADDDFADNDNQQTNVSSDNAGDASAMAPTFNKEDGVPQEAFDMDGHENNHKK